MTRVMSFPHLHPRFRSVSGGYQRTVLGFSPLAVWPMDEASGSVAYDRSGNGYHGAYTGVDLGQAGQFGRTCPYFDGTNDYADIYAAGSLITSNNWQEVTVAIWGKVAAAGVHTDGVARRLFQLSSDVNNNINIRHTVTNNLYNVQYLAGGTNKNVNITITTTDWFCAAITASKSADQVMGYLNGVQQGLTQTGLGTWNGDNSLANIQNLLGANVTTPNGVWFGYLQYAAVWTRALTPAEVLKLYTG